MWFYEKYNILNAKLRFQIQNLSSKEEENMCPTGPEESSYFFRFTGKATPISFFMGRICRASYLCSAIFQGFAFRYAALMILFFVFKMIFFVWTDATECFVQPHKTLSLPWAVCVRHHRLIQAKKWVCDQFSCAVSNSQSKFQEMENCIIFRLQVYSSASHNRENIGPLVEWQITSIEVIIYVFPDRHCSLATGTDTLHTFG